jgi:hypothetical protein
MSQSDENNKTKATNTDKDEPNIMMLSNNNESYQIMKNHRIKSERNKRKKPTGKKEEVKQEEVKNEDDGIDENINIDVIRKRSNSVKLYKKQKKERERKNKLRESSKNVKMNENIFEVQGSNKNMNKKLNKSSKNVREKRVTFKKQHLVEIIDVESYKKFNEDNTYQDPFDDPEFVKKLNQLNNNNIKNQNMNDNENEIDDGKERVNCSCFIF